MNIYDGAGAAIMMFADPRVEWRINDVERKADEANRKLYQIDEAFCRLASLEHSLREASALDMEEFIAAKKYYTKVANPEEMDGTESVSVAELREFMHRRVATASPQAAVPECVWEQDTDEDSWDTSCGAKWQFITDGPEENNIKFCHQCGGKVIHKERTE